MRASAKSQRSLAPGGDRNFRKQTLVLGLLLAVATFAVYFRVVGQPFAPYDDDLYVEQNAHVNGGLTLATVTWALTSTDQANWHPLTWLSHALDVELYGLNPAGHHFTNLLFHVANALLLFLLLAWATGAVGRSFLVAALFAIHPMNVESVAWIAERKNVLSTFFFLWTIAAYGWYALKPSLKRAALVAGLFALGLASKPMVITLPFVLLLMDFWPLRRITGWTEPSSQHDIPQVPISRIVLEKAPLLLLCAGSAAITLVAQGLAVKPLHTFSFAVRLENAACAYLGYVWKTFWPAALAPYYPHPGNSVLLWQVSLAALFLLGVSFVAWWQRQDRPYFLTGWLWFLGTLVPVIGLVQVGDQAMADRYAYIPLIGIFAIVVWYVADLADDFRASLTPRLLAAALILVPLTAMTVRQIGYWQSPYIFWAHTLEVTKDNPVAEHNLAAVLMGMGRQGEALAHFQNVARTHPTFSVSHLDLANILRSQNQIPEAMAEYAAAIQAAALNPDDLTNLQVLVIANIKLGNLYAEQGEYERARQAYQQAVQTDRAVADAEVSNLQQQAEAHPSAARYLCMGMILQQAGHKPEAISAYQRALELDPTVGEARRSLQDLQTGK